MKTWILSVTAVCLILTVLELFLSEGRTKKYVVGILRLGMVVVMLTPLLSFFKQSDLFQDVSPTEVETMSQQKDIAIKNEFFRTLTENELNKKGVFCTVDLEEENGRIRYVDVYLQESVISEQEGNIYKNSKTVTDTVKKYLGAEGECVRVWAK